MIDAPARSRPAALGLVASAALCGTGALLLFLTTRIAVPALVSATGMETVVASFLAASAVLFVPLLVIAAVLLYRERRSIAHGSWNAGCGFDP